MTMQGQGGSPAPGAAQGGAAPAREQPAFVGSADGQPLGAQGEPPPAPAGTEGAPPEGEVTPPPAAPRRVLETDLPPATLKARLDAASRKAAEDERARIFRELGIEDPQKFKTAREQESAELKKFRELEEKRKREAMSAQQRLEADLAKEREAKKALEAELSELRDARVYDQQEVVVSRAAAKHIDPDLYEDARGRFIRYVTSLSQEEAAAFDEKACERWFRDLAKKFPKFAPSAAATKEEEDEEGKKKPPTAAATPPTAKPKVPANPVRPPAQVRRPITTGAPPAKGAPKPAPTGVAGTVGGKTFKPGQANTMTKAEVRAEAKKMGINYPG